MSSLLHLKIGVNFFKQEAIEYIASAQFTNKYEETALSLKEDVHNDFLLESKLSKDIMHKYLPITDVKLKYEFAKEYLEKKISKKDLPRIRHYYLQKNGTDKILSKWFILPYYYLSYSTYLKLTAFDEFTVIVEKIHKYKNFRLLEEEYDLYLYKAIDKHFQEEISSFFEKVKNKFQKGDFDDFAFYSSMLLRSDLIPVFQIII